MGEKKFAKNPLLYIHQPNVGTPEAQMQYNYTTPKKITDSTPQQTQPEKTTLAKSINRKRSKEFSINQSTELNTEVEETELEADNNQENDTEKAEEEDNSGVNRPKFKDMTISEKIDYFVNAPKHLPRMKCEVKTEERSYRGVIVDSNEESIFMRVARKSSNTKIAISEINSIRLLGF